MSKNSPKSNDEEVQVIRIGRELDHLYRFAGTVGRNLDVDTLLTDVLTPLLTMAEAEKVFIALIVDEEKESYVLKQLGWPDLPKIEQLLEVTTMLGTEALGCDNQEALPASLPKVFKDFKGSFVLIPLLAYGRPLGLMVLARSGNPFGPSTLKLLNTAGRQLALAVENARLFADLQESYRGLMDAQEGLIQSERLAALGGLAATMAHEIRNPLATIFSSLSQIRKHAQITGDSATLLDIAVEEALRLNEMVSGLLEFARPKVPRLEEVRLVDVINEVINSTVGRSDFPSSVTLELKDGDREVVSRLDRELFRRALDLLVDNAVAAVGSKKGKITIEAKTVDSEKQDVMVTISDNGCGITADVKHSIFDPFFSTKPSGTGLGLPVVKQIIEDHEGKIEVDSIVEKGTHVRLLLPGNRGHY